jgi:hypothetical protein
MESKKINQLATEMTPTGSDLTIIGDPITGVSRKITLIQLAGTIGAGADLQQVTDNGATTTNPIAIGGLTITGLATGVLKSDSGVISSVPFGAANGVATLGGDGKVPSNQLPSYVDDVVEVANFAALPVTGETGKIYITLDNNKVYRWTGSIYVEIAANNAVWGAITGTLSNQTDLQTALNLKANDNAVVHLAGTETISGVKTFTTSNLFTGANLFTNFSQRFNQGVAILETANFGATVDYTTIVGAVNGLALRLSSDGKKIFAFADATTNNTFTFPNATGTIALTSDIPSLTGYVPYTGATTNVNLGTFDLTADVITAETGSFASSGGIDTFAINHSSGSGIALNITKGGNGEGLYINKTSGTGNAATIIGTLNATTLVKSGGTSSQFLKADGSVDSSTYLTTSAAASTYVTLGTTQTITGDKTFDGNNVYNGVNIYNTYQTRFTAGIAINQTLSGGAVGSHTVIGANVNGLNVNFPAGGYNSLNFASTSVSNTYTFPNATGTLALTTDLNAYLPLTGGTLSGQLSILRGSGTGLDVASDLVIFRASTGFGSPRQITLAAGNGATTYLEAKGYGGNYITDFGIRTYNASGTAFEVFFATSAGDVGIGNTAPAAKLDVNGSGRFVGSVSIGTTNSSARLNVQAASNFETATLGTATGTMGYLSANGLYGMYIGIGNSGNTWLQSQRNDGSTTAYNLLLNPQGGNVGIGTSSPQRTLSIANGGPTVEIDPNGGAAGPIYFNYNRSTATYLTPEYWGLAHKFMVNGGNEAMRITSGGLGLFGTTTDNSGGIFQVKSPSGQNAINGQVSNNGNASLVGFNAASDYTFYVLGTGQIYSTSVTIALISSDRNLKTDIKDYDKGLAEILAMKPRYYKYKDNLTEEKSGFIAQEMDEAIQGSMIDSPMGNHKTYQVEWFPLLVKAIQEQQAQIEELKAKIK